MILIRATQEIDAAKNAKIANGVCHVKLLGSSYGVGSVLFGPSGGGMVRSHLPCLRFWFAPPVPVGRLGGMDAPGGRPIPRTGGGGRRGFLLPVFILPYATWWSSVRNAGVRPVTRMRT